MIEQNQLEESLALAAPKLWGSWQTQAVETTQAYTQSYTIGQLRFHLTIYGLLQHSGQLVVYQDGLPVWSMVFTGHVLDKPGIDSDRVLSYLIDTFQSQPSLRCPDNTPTHGFIYKSSRIGDLDDLEGRDWIEMDQTVVYRGTFHCGMIR